MSSFTNTELVYNIVKVNATFNLKKKNLLLAEKHVVYLEKLFAPYTPNFLLSDLINILYLVFLRLLESKIKP